MGAVAPAPPRTAVGVADCAEDDDLGLCHVLGDHGPLCGEDVAGDSPGVHVANPFASPCDACGRPRCERCLELWTPS
jgi:hypothetical protein